MASNVISFNNVKGMKKLDRSKFNTKIKVLSVNTSLDDIANKIKELKKYLLKRRNLKSVTEVEDSKVILLDPSVIKDYDDFSADAQEKLTKAGLTKNNFKQQEIELNYENFTANEILEAVLPSDVEGSTSYSQIGHICHLNLRDHLIDYRFIIGDVFLDKVPNVKSVVNKTDIIDSTYRNFKMEVLSGINEMNVSVKENGCIFIFDFSKVYWNPRLSTEHLRVVQTVKKYDYLFDVFSGVGPFSIPAAKKKCNVFSNDLNPYSYQALLKNVKKNNITKDIKAWNMDGREFILTVLKPEMLNCWKKEHETRGIERSYHIVMNLPAIAIEFLDSFLGLFCDVEQFDEIFVSPVVHCYCFSKDADAESDVKQMVIKILKGNITENEMEVFFVRSVAPNKKMMRVSFKLSSHLLKLKNFDCNEGIPEAKRSRLDD